MVSSGCSSSSLCFCTNRLLLYCLRSKAMFGLVTSRIFCSAFRLVWIVSESVIVFMVNTTGEVRRQASPAFVGKRSSVNRLTQDLCILNAYFKCLREPEQSHHAAYFTPLKVGLCRSRVFNGRSVFESVSPGRSNRVLSRVLRVGLWHLQQLAGFFHFHVVRL